jgi:hypothetical protein
VNNRHGVSGGLGESADGCVTQVVGLGDAVLPRLRSA